MDKMFCRPRHALALIGAISFLYLTLGHAFLLCPFKMEQPNI